MGKHTSWEERFEELKGYRKENGNYNVPRNYQHNKQLGLWVNKQRYEYKKFQKGESSAITKERILKLKSIDFTWRVGIDRKGLTNDELWGKRFNELKDYHKKYGNCRVPQKYQANKQLGLWVHKQRIQFKKFQKGEKSSITIERIAKLKSINFVWNVGNDGTGLSNDELWENRFNELKDYRKKYGNCNVPKNYQHNKQLATWVATQRKHFKKFQNGEITHLTEERITKLESIDFVWETRRAPHQRQDQVIMSKTTESTTSVVGQGTKELQHKRKAINTTEKIYPKKRKPKRQKQQQDEPFPVPVPSSSSSSSPGFFAESSQIEERVLRMDHFRDECLAIGLRRADREVWGIIHS